MTASEMGIEIGSIVLRQNDYGKLVEWEVVGIDKDGVCIDIENDDDFLYIMADDCILISK